MVAPHLIQVGKNFHFSKKGIKNPVLRKDQDLENIHWSTTRKGNIKKILIFAFDHRTQFEQLVNKLNSSKRKKSLYLKIFYLKAALKVSNKKKWIWNNL